MSATEAAPANTNTIPHHHIEREAENNYDTLQQHIQQQQQLLQQQYSKGQGARGLIFENVSDNCVDDRSHDGFMNGNVSADDNYNFVDGGKTFDDDDYGDGGRGNRDDDEFKDRMRDDEVNQFVNSQNTDNDDDKSVDGRRVGEEKRAKVVSNDYEADVPSRECPVSLQLQDHNTNGCHNDESFSSDRSSFGKFSLNSNDVIDNLSQNNNGTADSFTPNHNVKKPEHCTDDSSEVLNQNDDKPATVCKGFEKPQHTNNNSDGLSTVTTNLSVNDHVHSLEKSNCSESETPAVTIENGDVSMCVMVDNMNENTTDNNAVNISDEPTNTSSHHNNNGPVNNSDEHTGMDNQNNDNNAANESDEHTNMDNETALNIISVDVRVDKNEQNLLNSETGDVENKQPTKNASGPKKWSKAVTSILTKTIHKSEEKNAKEHPHASKPISDKLPEVHHEGILHTGSHTNSQAAHKKLTFQIPVPADKGQTPNGTTVVDGPCNNQRFRSGSLKKLSRHFTFTPFSKRVHKKQESSPEQSETVTKAVVVTETSSDRSKWRSSEPRQSAKRSIPKPPQSPRWKWCRGDSQEGDQRCKCCLPFTERLHKWWQGDSSIEGKEIRNTLVVGVAFQLIFTAHFAIQNLQSSLHEEQHLGASALGCLYAASIFSSIFAPTIIGVLGLKGCLVLAWVTHMLYTLAQFYPTWQTLVPASVLLGALTGPTWTAQGVYVSACAYSFSKRSPHSPYTILSRFNGLFFTLYETRQIVGNLLSSVVLRDGVGNKSQETIFKYCGARDCPASENTTDIEDPDNLVINIMLTIYMALQVVALVLTVVLLTPLSRTEWWSRAPVRETAASWFKTLVGTRMLFLVPFMVFQAMEQGILLSEYTKSYVSCPIGIHMVGFVMATHGATSAVFVFVFSLLARRTGRYPLFAFATLINLVLLIVLYDWTPQSSQQALIFVFPVLWGIGEGIWQTQTNSMIAVVFWNRKEPAFANYQTWRAVGYTLIFSFHSFLCVGVKIIITISFLVVGMILYTAVEIYSYRKERNVLRKPEGTEINGALSPATISISASSQDLQESRPEPSPEPPPAEPLDFELKNIDSPASVHSVMSLPRSFRFEDDSDLESGGLLTLDGTYLTRGESAYLDNDLKKFGVIPTSGTRPLSLTKCYSAKSLSDECDRWAVKEDDDAWNSGSFDSANQRPARPHTWHEVHFRDEGELQIVRTKDDVFVY